MTKEQKFYSALKDIFVGAKVEGESGYINLMRIKSRYYEKGVFPKLQKDIEKAVEPFPEFKEELFDKLYTFFQRYFSESGSIYFRYTPLHQNVYEKVYTDDKDVILFWKTHMLYYVKTDRLFNNLEVDIDGYKFFFDVSALEHKKANEKREIIFEFKEKRKDGVLVFNVFYSEKGKKTKIDDILRSLKKEGIEITEEILEKAFRVFEKQSEVDYFINKNAKEFLKEQFDIWLYQYVFKGISEWTEKRIKQLQVLKDIAFKIIDFISQFEDELLKIWNKPKFVLNSNYVITLDRIAEKDKELKIIEKILKHSNFDTQVKEWKELGIIDDKFEKNKIIENNSTGKRISEDYQYLPVDTRYFKDLELEILGLFDDLDNSLDGWLIKSENYQALNTILPKFKEKVQTIYIDPPYNTGNDGFLYKDNYQHSSWLTLMENRLSLARELMKDDGVLFISIDDNELYNLKNLNIMDFLANVIRVTGSTRNMAVNFDVRHDYLLILAKNMSKVKGFEDIRSDNSEFNNWDSDPNGKWSTQDLTVRNGGYEYEVPSFDFRKKFKRKWRFPIDRLKEEMGGNPDEDFEPIYKRAEIIEISNNKEIIVLNKIVFKKKDGVPYYKKYLKDVEGITVNTLWNDLESQKKANEDLNSNLFSVKVFDNPKPVSLVEKILRISNKEDDQITLDFFAGSGTTAHAVMKLNKEDGGRRKFILVEMADCFDTVIIPRIKKLAYSFNWKDGKPQDSDGIGGFFKYYELEQYEDSLRKVKYEDSDLFDNPYQAPYNRYVFMKDLKMLEALEIDYENNKVKVDFSKLYPNIDIPETLSNLLGKWIKKITSDFVEFEDGERIDLKNLDYKLIKPLIWW